MAASVVPDGERCSRSPTAGRCSRRTALSRLEAPRPGPARDRLGWLDAEAVQRLHDRAKVAAVAAEAVSGGGEIPGGPGHEAPSLGGDRRERRPPVGRVGSAPDEA